MLDLTGIEAVERPELKHLVTQVAGKIENALILAQSHALMVRLNWPGNAMGSDADGILCLDADGWITGANQTARQMVPNLSSAPAVHVGDVFGVPYQMLFDAVRRSNTLLEVPLWTGLRLQAMPIGKAQALSGRKSAALKDIESALIIQAVEQAKGNVHRPPPRWASAAPRCTASWPVGPTRPDRADRPCGKIRPCLLPRQHP